MRAHPCVPENDEQSEQESREDSEKAQEKAQPRIGMQSEPIAVCVEDDRNSQWWEQECHYAHDALLVSQLLLLG